jgi:acyl-CoA synthetase (AMP-forming)/AMP-acid ligase II
MAALFECLLQHAAEHAEAVAVCRSRWDGTYEETTYGHLAERSRQFASAFAAQIPEGQIIPLCLGKTADTVAAMLAALGAGRAFCCIHRKLKPPQIEHMLRQTQAPVALVDSHGLLSLKGGIRRESEIARPRWWLLRDTDFGPAHERLVEELRSIAAVEELAPSRLTTHVRTTPANPVMADRNVCRAHAPSESPDRVGCCLFTSGSTGVCKGVLLGAEGLQVCAAAEAALYELRPDDVLLSMLPFSFDVGLMQLLSALDIGCELVIVDSWLPHDILRVAAERRVTGISAVPSIWLDFLNHGIAFETAGAHRSLRYVTVSGGDMTRPRLDQLPELAPGVGIYKTYGQTESFRSTSLRPGEFAEKRCSVGRSLRGVHVYIVRPDGSLAAPNEIGEVVHTGAGTLLGYLGGEGNETKLRPNPARGRGSDDHPLAVFTGDLGYLDTEGYLFLRGRRDDLVKVSGYRVYPNEVREIITAVPGVSQAEVIAVKQAEAARLVAFVILAPDTDWDEATLRGEISRRAPSYLVPERLEIRRSLPRTASGKPDRQQLLAEAADLLLGSDPKGSATCGPRKYIAGGTS